MPEGYSAAAQNVPYEIAIAHVQELEPVGVGARLLPECLLLQLTGRDPISRLAREIVEEHLDMLGGGSLPQLIATTGATEMQLMRRQFSLTIRSDRQTDQTEIPFSSSEVTSRRLR